MPALVEARLLDGPNLYFPRAALKLTLDASALTRADAATVRAVCSAVGLERVRPGEAGSEQRQRVALRVLRTLLRAVAKAGGTTRLAVRGRPGASPDEVVLAFPWKRAERAEVLAREVAALLDELSVGHLGEAVARAGAVLSDSPGGHGPAALRASVPVVSVTGTNGKTTTTRMLAHLGMTAGLRTAWSSTDGVVVQGEVVEPGDYSGPAGARQVLETPGVELAVLETARGGLLLRGMGVVANDVSVVTNVSADHLGAHGVDTLDQLAEVKAVVTKVTRPRGWVVLNGDDPRVLAMRRGSPARPFVFSLDAGSPALREALDAGGRAATVLDGDMAVLSPGADPDHLVAVVDVPLTMAGLSQQNTANALAAMAAGLAVGLPREAVVAGLQSFRPDPSLNPGRMNMYSVPLPASPSGGSATVLLDLAHNEAGLEALLRVASGVRAPGARVLLGVGGVGDRSDAMLEALGALGARGADRVAIVHKEKYLRGRTVEELGNLLRQGAASVGVLDVPSFPSELAGLRGLLDDAAAGDVVAVMVHADQPGLDAWLREQGATVDGLEDVRRKVRAATGGDEPDRARRAFAAACTRDREGREADAVPLYREALALGLVEPRRTQARVQLASSQRVLGDLSGALAELDGVLAERPGSVAAHAFRALVLHDLGRHGDAVAEALTELSHHVAGSDAEGYARALAAYADELRSP